MADPPITHFRPSHIIHFRPVQRGGSYQRCADADAVRGLTQIRSQTADADAKLTQSADADAVADIGLD